MFEVEIKFDILNSNVDKVIDQLYHKKIIKDLKGKEKNTITTYLDTADNIFKNHKGVLRLRENTQTKVKSLEYKGDITTINNFFQRVELSIELEADKTINNISCSDVNKLFKESFGSEKTGKNKVYEDILKNIEGRPIVPLFSINMNREIHKLLRDESTLELSIDRCFMESKGEKHYFNQLEVELVSGPEEALKSLNEELSSIDYINITEKSKFQRGLELLN